MLPGISGITAAKLTPPFLCGLCDCLTHECLVLPLKPMNAYDPRTANGCGFLPSNCVYNPNEPNDTNTNFMILGVEKERRKVEEGEER